LFDKAEVCFCPKNNVALLRIMSSSLGRRAFAQYSHMLNTLRPYTQGNSLLEVDVGRSECIVAAR